VNAAGNPPRVREGTRVVEASRGGRWTRGLGPTPTVQRRSHAAGGELVVQAVNVEQVTRLLPSVSIPAGITAPEDLETGTRIAVVMVCFERIGPRDAMIPKHIVTNYGHSTLRATPGADPPVPGETCRKS